MSRASQVLIKKHLFERMEEIEIRVEHQICQIAYCCSWLRAARGENLLKSLRKIFLQGKPFTEDNVFHMKRELGDIIWYWATACMALDLDPYEVINENKSKLEARYGKGFKVEKSEHRKDGDL